MGMSQILICSAHCLHCAAISSYSNDSPISYNMPYGVTYETTKDTADLYAPALLHQLMHARLSKVAV